MNIIKVFASIFNRAVSANDLIIILFRKINKLLSTNSIYSTLLPKI